MPPPAASPNRPVATRTRGLRQSLPRTAPSTNTRLIYVDLHGPSTNDPTTVYRSMVPELKTRYKIAIRRWRRHMSGVAYELTYQDGRIKRLISAPRPRSPVSAAIFLHEVGHHAIGFRRYTPRCLEEHYVWQWVFREMAARDIPVNARVLRHHRRSMYHYVKLARKHGQHIPHELHQFAHWPG